jgi:hypothetical protein
MGLLDRLRTVVGAKASADATRDADAEDLFDVSTAYVTMEANLGYVPTGDAALCFGDVDSTDFRDAVDEVEAIVAAGEEETGTESRSTADDYGYRWIVFHDRTFEDLVTSVHFAADTIVEANFGSRLLAAVFGFEHERDGRRAYWIYSFRRGAFYPFVPADVREHERDSTAEFKLESTLSGELDVEDDREYWYPLWPDVPGGEPWE